MRHLLLWLMLLLPGVSLAANPKAAALVKEGGKLYKEGKYKEAAEALSKAYAIDPDPTVLYNKARALDQAGELRASLEAYREFVGLEGAEKDLVKKANLAMDRLRGLVAKLDAEEAQREQEKKKADEDRKKAEEAAAAEKAKVEAELAAAQQREKELQSKQEKEQSAAVKTYNLRKALAFVAGGVAIASVGTGIILGVSSNGARNKFNTATSVAEKDRYQSETKSLALGADICYGAAIVFAAATIIIFPKYADPSVEKKVDVAVAPIPGGFAASIGAKF
jgi:tetratricopeptide (TPR) repeat protein